MLSWRIRLDNIINRLWWKNIETTCIEFALRYKLRFWLFWFLNSNKYSSLMSFRKKINPYSIPIMLKINDLTISNQFTWDNWHYLIFRSQYKWRFKLRKFEADNIFNGVVPNDGVRNVELAITFILTALSW